jgi:hypothetical protein
MTTAAGNTQTAKVKTGAKPKAKAKAKASARNKPAAKGTRTTQAARTATSKRAAHKPAPVVKEQPREGLNGPDTKLMEEQSGFWNFLMNRYFRLECNGFERLPDEPCLLIGIHSGGPLTMDAWTLILDSDPGLVAPVWRDQGTARYRPRRADEFTGTW